MRNIYDKLLPPNPDGMKYVFLTHLFILWCTGLSYTGMLKLFSLLRFVTLPNKLGSFIRL